MHMSLTRRTLATALLASFAAAAAPAALAQDNWPNRPVKIIVPVPAGQSTDLIARLVGERLQQALGQPFVVENKAGAGTTIGTEAGARAEPDGYTLVMATSGGMAVAPALYAKLRYSPERDFAPITNLATVVQTMVTRADAPFSNLAEFIARAQGGTLSYASAGTGSTSHLATEMFLQQAKVKATHVPFKGAAEAQPQVIGGQIDFMLDALPAVAPQIKSGRLKAIGVGSAQRTPLLPQAQTMAEQGLTGFEAIGWIGLAAPANTPAPILDRLNAEVRRIMAAPDVRERLQNMYFTAADGTRDEFAQFIRKELAKWNAVAKAAGIQPQ